MKWIVELGDRGFVASSRSGVHCIPLRHPGDRKSRLPESELRDIEDWMTTIGRNNNAGPNWGLMPDYDIGMVPVDEDSPETLRSFDVDLKEWNEEAVNLAAQIARNFEELEV